MTENSKKLPFEANVPLRCYQMFSYPLGIAYASGCDISKWLYKNFIQLKYEPNSHLKFNFVYEWFGRWPFFKVQILDRAVLYENNVELYSFIRNSIDANRYIVTNINERYHPDRAAYHKKDFIHDILILGYRDGSLITIGYTPAGYQESMLSMPVFTEMFLSLPSQFLYLVEMYKNLEDYFDIPLTRYYLESYLNPGICTANPYLFLSTKEGARYGVDIYDPLISLVEQQCEAGQKIDMRYIGVLVEHKHLMHERIQFFTRQHRMEDLHREQTLERIDRLCLSLQKNCLRYREDRDAKRAAAIRRDMETIRMLEVPVLEAMLHCLE